MEFLLSINFSPGSFSAVNPPEIFPEVNLYFVRLFSGEPFAEVSLLPDFIEKLASKLCLKVEDPVDLIISSDILMKGAIIETTCRSKPGMFAISKTETIFPDDEV